jgi:hypothetical protein
VSNSDGDNVLRYNGTTGAFIDEFIPDGSGGLEDSAGLTFAAFSMWQTVPTLAR